MVESFDDALGLRIGRFADHHLHPEHATEPLAVGGQLRLPCPPPPDGPAYGHRVMSSRCVICCAQPPAYGHGGSIVPAQATDAHGALNGTGKRDAPKAPARPWRRRGVRVGRTQVSADLPEDRISAIWASDADHLVRLLYVGFFLRALRRGLEQMLSEHPRRPAQVLIAL